MTGYTVHTGSNKKFTSGWDRVFQGGGKKTATPKPKKSAKKKSRG